MCNLACLRLPFLLFLIGLLTACLIPAPGLNDGAVSPAEGYARTTQFTFSVTVRSDESIPQSASDNLAVFLELYSPDIDNEWAWREIQMSHEGNGHFSVSTALAEYSTAYKYRFSVKDKDAVLATSQDFSGPKLNVDKNDSAAPRVVRTYPLDMAVGVDPSQQLQVEFNEVIDPRSIASARVSILEPASARQTSTLSAYQNRLLIQLAAPFDQSFDPSQFASRYSVKIEGITDLNGNVMEPHTLKFHIASPLFQTFRIESQKYAGHCLTVRDVKKRFAAPTAWNPVVEITPCMSLNPDLSQRWLLTKNLTPDQPMQLRWAQNYDYCLHKNNLSDPVIRRCTDGNRAQQFALVENRGAYHLESQDGGCVAAGVVDFGDKNKVESSLCANLFERNRWLIQMAEKQELSPAFFLGKYNISVANIKYANPPANVSLSTVETRELVKYLYKTEALNQKQIYDELKLETGAVAGAGFVTANPYYPAYTGKDIQVPRTKTVVRNGVEIVNPEGYADPREGYKTDSNGNLVFHQQKIVSQWFSDVTNKRSAASQVCAVKFNDGDDIHYTMKTFASKDEALQAGYTITHQNQCGTCSTLKDLAVYIGIPDLTTPTRLCTKRGQGKADNLDEVAKCIEEAVGFTPMCAETWAYNGQHTGTECRSTCLAAYGNNALLWPKLNGFFKMVIAEKFDACPAEVESSDPAFRAAMQADGCPLANENTGKLNACLWCDEQFSGPGFKYAAARTRRASGLLSSIPRPNDTIYYDANHTLYFK